MDRDLTAGSPWPGPASSSQHLTTTLPSAIVQAHSDLEPVFYPTPVYQDDRGWSMMNLLRASYFPDPLDSWQINYSVTHPGVIKAWHRHNTQTDYWMVLNGDLKVAVTDEKKMWTFVIGEHNPGILIIPPTLWHGCYNHTPTPVGLLYLVTKEYDASEPDESRCDFKKFTHSDPTNPLKFSWDVMPR